MDVGDVPGPVTIVRYSDHFLDDGSDLVNRQTLTYSNSLFSVHLLVVL